MLITDEEVPVAVAVPIRQILVTLIVAIEQVEPDRCQRQHGGLGADGGLVRIMGDTAVKAIKRQRRRPQEHHRVVHEAKRF